VAGTGSRADGARLRTSAPVLAVVIAATHGVPTLPGDVEDQPGDDEPDDGIGDRRTQRHDERAQDHTRAHDPVATGMIAVGDQSGAMQASPAVQADARGDPVSQDADHAGEAECQQVCWGERLDDPKYAGTFRIVGIVRDAKFAGFALSRPARPMFFVPLAQNIDYGGDALMSRIERSSHLIRGIALETDIPPGVLEPLVKKTLAEVDLNLTVVNLRTFQEQVALRFDRERAVSTLASLFGIVALLLAAVGMYGVTAYSVVRRTAEIGIRMALGADRAKVVGMVLRGASYRVLIGIAAGVPLAIGAGRLLSAELYGVTNWDPLALVLAASALSACAFLAAVIPATRAASISPTSALRTE